MFRNPPVDIIVILIIVLLFLGPKRLPGLGRGLGQGMREFKEGINGQSEEGAEKPQLPGSTPKPKATAGSSDPADTSASATSRSGRSQLS